MHGSSGHSPASVDEGFVALTAPAISNASVALTKKGTYRPATFAAATARISPIALAILVGAAIFNGKAAGANADIGRPKCFVSSNVL